MAGQTVRPASSTGRRRCRGTTRAHWLTPAVKMAGLARADWPAPPNAALRWRSVPRIATRTPVMDAEAVCDARHFTIATLQRWGVVERCEDIAIVVTELLTNALRHALPASGVTTPLRLVRLGLARPGPWVLCAVADPSQRTPVPRAPDYLAETGRGLHVIAALSDDWGYTAPSDMGKILWATFLIGPSETRAPRIPA